MNAHKKNTKYRNFKAWSIRLDRKQQQEPTISSIDETNRVCMNCGEKYRGRFCPQCGQSGLWERFSTKQAIINFIDIWGLGNRPMFRTVYNLFWRPGYMVREYLNGHRQFYFPPFKLLSLTILFLLTIYYVTGQKYDSFTPITEQSINQLHLGATLTTMLKGVTSIINYIISNPLYEQFAIIAFCVCLIKIAFNKIGGYNYTEIFIFLIYLASLSFLIDIPDALVKGLFNLSDKHLLTPIKFTSPALYTTLFAIGSGITTIVSVILGALSLYLSLLAFRQFFGLSWKATIARFLYVILLITIIIAILGIAYAAFIESGMMAFIGFLGFVMVIIALILLYRKYHSIWALVPLILIIAFIVLILIIALMGL